MKRLLGVLLVAIACVACVGADDVSVTGVREVSLSASALEMKVGVENRAACRLQLRRCDLDVSVRGRTALKVRLTEPVVVAGHFAGQVPLSLRVQLTDPLAGLVALGTLRSSPDVARVSGEIVVKAGWRRKRIRLDGEPLSKILSDLGIDKQMVI